jgi:hypothetical protein
MTGCSTPSSSVRLVENVILFRSDYDGPVCERDKYRHTKEDTIMDTTDDQEMRDTMALKNSEKSSDTRSTRS